MHKPLEAMTVKIMLVQKLFGRIIRKKRFEGYNFYKDGDIFKLLIFKEREYTKA